MGKQPLNGTRNQTLDSMDSQLPLGHFAPHLLAAPLLGRRP